MAIPTDIYSLFEITQLGGISRILLTRVCRRGFSNATPSDEDAADEEAMAEESLLSQRFVETQELKGIYEIRKIGEMQGYPVGNALNDPEWQGDTEVWIADTSHGAPWVVLGTADSEKEFWDGVEENSGLWSLKPIRPARLIRAHYLQIARTLS